MGPPRKNIATSDSMNAEQESQALQKIQESQAQVRKTGVADYIQDVKSSVLFRPGYNWNELLSAAPISISLLASLFVASTIPDALQIKILPPDGGFKHLQNFEKPSLNACLIQCSDKGVKAFGASANSFDAISLKSNVIKQTVNQIIKLLGDAESATTLLAPTVKTLSTVAKDCEVEAKAMETVFTEWLDMVCELHMCVVQTSSDASEKQAANQIQLAAAKTRLASAEEAKKMAKESVKTLKSSLETATSAYKKAADEFPSGWDLVAQQFVSSLSDSFTNAINLVVPALIENYSMTAKVEAGVNIFKGGNGGAEGGSLGDGKADHSSTQPATNAPAAVPSAVPPFPNDPAYGVIGPIQGYVTTIQSFLTGGPDKGVDWDLLSSKDPAKVNHGLGVMAALMDDASQSFKPSNNPPSQTLLSIFANVKKVTDELQKVLDDNKNINDKNTLPKAGSDAVVQWQTDIAKEAVRAVQLDTEAKALTNSRGTPMINTPQAQSSPSDKSGAFRKQIIDAATTKLDQTAKVMQTMSENYQKSSAKLVDVQLKLGEIKGELESLKASNINLDTIKAILIKCIDILVQLKSQVGRLVAFFSAVSTLVEHVVDDQVGSFITYINASTGPDISIHGYSFTDLQSQMIFGFALNIRAYFELFREIAGMYLDVDGRFIRPGIDLVNSMQAEYTGGGDDADKKLQERTQEVAKFTSKSTDGVKQLVQQRQDEINGSLQDQATQCAQDLEFIPVRPARQIGQAIGESTERAQEVAAKGINASGKYLTRPLTDTSSLIDNSDDS